MKGLGTFLFCLREYVVYVTLTTVYRFVCSLFCRSGPPCTQITRFCTCFDFPLSFIFHSIRFSCGFCKNAAKDLVSTKLCIFKALNLIETFSSLYLSLSLTLSLSRSICLCLSLWIPSSIDEYYFLIRFTHSYSLLLDVFARVHT